MASQNSMTFPKKDKMPGGTHKKRAAGVGRETTGADSWSPTEPV